MLYVECKDVADKTADAELNKAESVEICTILVGYKRKRAKLSDDSRSHKFRVRAESIMRLHTRNISSTDSCR
jgi:hypothetical protein